MRSVAKAFIREYQKKYPNENMGKYEIGIIYDFIKFSEAAQQTGEAGGATVCPECDGAVEYCAMGHYVPAKSASSMK